MEGIKSIVSKFYTNCLTVNSETNLSEEMDKLFADNFQSINAKETKGKAVLLGQVQYFWKLIPDLKWIPQDILQDGNKVIVRSIVTGSPKGDFMGMKLDGSKSFNIMSIDIHTVENDKIITVYHQEEWTTAIAQLK